MATAFFAVGLLLVMALSGYVAAQAPRTLVQTTDAAHRDHRFTSRR
ncbi:hypothetical protein [Rhodococcoides trifolii]|nr:hypothetical protein [Rhodococcus trifolii]